MTVKELRKLLEEVSDDALIMFDHKEIGLLDVEAGIMMNNIAHAIEAERRDWRVIYAVDVSGKAFGQLFEGNELIRYFSHCTIRHDGRFKVAIELRGDEKITFRHGTRLTRNFDPTTQAE